MANAVFNSGLQAFLQGDVDWLSDDIKVVLIDTGTYTFDAADDFLSDIPAGAREGTSGNLAGKTATDGVADANDVTITGVSGDTIEALIIYKDTGVEGTSQLLLYLDSVTSGLPLTPNGGDVTIEWDDGANKIFKL